jgi:hypothetical protein
MTISNTTLLLALLFTGIAECEPRVSFIDPEAIEARFDFGADDERTAAADADR